VRTISKHNPKRKQKQTITQKRKSQVKILCKEDFFKGVNRSIGNVFNNYILDWCDGGGGGGWHQIRAGLI
jgi:ribosomal protein L36